MNDTTQVRGMQAQVIPWMTTRLEAMSRGPECRATAPPSTLVKTQSSVTEISPLSARSDHVSGAADVRKSTSCASTSMKNPTRATMRSRDAAKRVEW